MSNRKVLSIVLVSALVIVGGCILWQSCNHTRQHDGETIVDSKNKKLGIKDLHKDILRLIASSKKPITGIDPKDAEIELRNRLSSETQTEKDAKVGELPYEILLLIAKSPATIAGIKPRDASNELVRRYLSIDLTDSEDISSTVLLEALQHHGEQKAIDDWANNEDAEAVEAFMKEEADKDPSSIANFAIGLKKLNDDHALAMSYMDRYANHVHRDSFDTPNEEKAFKELIATIKKLK